MHTVVKVNSNGHLSPQILWFYGLLQAEMVWEAESTYRFKILCEDMPER